MGFFRNTACHAIERAVRMVREHGPATLTWVDWFNTRWLMEPIRCEHRGQ